VTDGSLRRALDAAFHPGSIAVIGASNSARLGFADMHFLIEAGYPGRIYPVNPKDDLVQGHRAYPSVLDIPGEVERAAVIVSRKMVPAVIKECAQKGVRVVQIYSAGFGEMGEEGKALERELAGTARAGGMRIIGPNCIGTYCPSGRITFTKGVSLVPGSIAFVSQSGGITFDLISRGENMGLRFSKVVSAGNCIDLDHADYLEYLAQDEETKAIGFYVEAVKDLQRFTSLLREVTPGKPVVILKGGSTGAGSRMVDWHTGNAAGDFAAWETAIGQAGAISVRSVDQMLAALVSIQYLKPFQGGGVAVVGNGGGASVLAADYCLEAKLELAELSGETSKLLIESGVSAEHWNLNPVDMPAGVLAADDGRLFGKVVKAISEDPSVSQILIHINLIPILNYLDLNRVLVRLAEELDSVDRGKANLALVLRYNGSPEIEKIRHEAAKHLLEKGIPVYGLIEQAAFGIGLVADLNKGSTPVKEE